MREYIEELYDKENKPSEDTMKMEKAIEVVDENLGPKFLYEEALLELKNGKAAGVDNTPGEPLKALGNSRKQELYDICKNIYAKGG